MIVGIIVLVLVALFVLAVAAQVNKLNKMDPEERAAYIEEHRRLPTAPKEAVPGRRSAISEVGRTDTGLACPRCGGAQFKARRSNTRRAGIAATTVATGGIAGLGAAAVLRKKQVQCVTCGAKYVRG